MIKVSRHAEMRIRERQGLNKKSIERMAQKAFDKGIRHEQTKGNLNKWLTSKYFVSELLRLIEVGASKDKGDLCLI